jgi:molybdate transport system substrate-binding protein
MNRRRPVLLVIVGITLICQLSASQEITVAVAADLQSVMQDVSTRFEREMGKRVKVIFGSSGNFFQQIQNGAPFDMFFSANLDYPKKLQEAGAHRNRELLTVCQGQNRGLGSQ